MRLWEVASGRELLPEVLQKTQGIFSEVPDEIAHALLPLADQVESVGRPVGLGEGRYGPIADAWAMKNAETGCKCCGDDFLPHRRNGW